MPSKSPKQARTMRAAAHDKKFAKKMGIPQKVAKEYADMGIMGAAMKKEMKKKMKKHG